MGFGKSKQKSENQSQQTSTSFNQAYPFLQGALGDQVGNAGKGSSAIASLLGLSGSDAQDAGFQKFKDSSGYNFIQDEGIRGITSSNAAKGLLGSGSALRGITKFSSNLASNFLNSYLSNLMGLSNTGIQAGQILASAGNTANSQGTSYGTSSGSSFNASLG
jgi:hypothetical protein